MRKRSSMLFGLVGAAFVSGLIFLFIMMSHVRIDEHAMQRIKLGMTPKEVEQSFGRPADYDSRTNPHPDRHPYGRYVVQESVPGSVSEFFSGPPQSPHYQHWVSFGMRRAIMVRYGFHSDQVVGVWYETVLYSSKSGEPFLHHIMGRLGL